MSFTVYYLFGDFNAKHTNWKYKKNNTSGVHIQNWLETSGNEMISPNSPTSKRSEPIIDFVLTHDASGWLSEVLNEGTSDHYPILFQSPIAVGNDTFFRKVNWKLFNFFLKNSSKYLMSLVYNLDEQTFFSLFSQFLSSLHDKCSLYENTLKYRPPWPPKLVLLSKNSKQSKTCI